MRLRIMATLDALDHGNAIAHPRLKSIVEATDRGLGAHVTALENAGYVAEEEEEDFVGKKAWTRTGVTPSGRRACAQHVAYLREIIDGPAERPDDGVLLMAPVAVMAIIDMPMMPMTMAVIADLVDRRGIRTNGGCRLGRRNERGGSRTGRQRRDESGGGENKG